MTKFKFNEIDYEYGLDLKIHVSFIQKDSDTMELLSATVSDTAYQSIDYSDVADLTTLLDVIKEFMKGE